GDGQARQGLVREVPRRRSAVVLPADLLLEDADRRLRQRQEGLHGLHEVAAGLDRPQGLTGSLAGARRGVSGALWRRPWAKGAAVLVPPTGAFLAVYIAALVALFVAAFWTVDSFTGKLVHDWTTANFQTLWNDEVYRHVAFRTIAIAALVTIADAII